MPLNGTPRQTLRAYAKVLAEFGRSQDFNLKGVWEALRYAPTFTLSDGSKLRPLTAQVFLRRQTDDGTARFEVVSFEVMGDALLTAFAPGRSWRITRHDQP
jgi:hypothetical protein